LRIALHLFGILLVFALAAAGYYAFEEIGRLGSDLGLGDLWEYRYLLLGGLVILVLSLLEAGLSRLAPKEH